MINSGQKSDELRAIEKRIVTSQTGAPCYRPTFRPDVVILWIESLDSGTRVEFQCSDCGLPYDTHQLAATGSFANYLRMVERTKFLDVLEPRPCACGL